MTLQFAVVTLTASVPPLLDPVLPPPRTLKTHLDPNDPPLLCTGLSASGKSTVACTLEHLLNSRGHYTVLLDGDNIRHGLNKDLGFRWVKGGQSTSKHLSAMLGVLWAFCMTPRGVHAEQTVDAFSHFALKAACCGLLQC